MAHWVVRRGRVHHPVPCGGRAWVLGRDCIERVGGLWQAAREEMAHRAVGPLGMSPERREMSGGLETLLRSESGAPLRAAACTPGGIRGVDVSYVMVIACATVGSIQQVGTTQMRHERARTLGNLSVQLIFSPRRIDGTRISNKGKAGGSP